MGNIGSKYLHILEFLQDLFQVNLENTKEFLENFEQILRKFRKYVKIFHKNYDKHSKNWRNFWGIS